MILFHLYSFLKHMAISDNGEGVGEKGEGVGITFSLRSRVNHLLLKTGSLDNAI